MYRVSSKKLLKIENTRSNQLEPEFSFSFDLSIQIKSDRKETENKTIRFPVDMLARIDTVMRENDVSFTGFVLQACEYVLDELENDSSTKNSH